MHAVPGVGTVVGPAAATLADDPSPGVPDPTSAAAAAASNITGGVAGQPRRRPPEPALSRQRVVATAIEIADNEGLAALSMRRVAAELGTATMSLYRHVRGKDDLLMLMVESTFARYPLPARAADPRAALEAVCRLQWSTYQRHPWLAQWVSMTRPQLIPSAMAHTERAMAVLADLGLDVNERLHMAVTLANYVRGTAINLEPEAQAEQDTGITSHEWMALAGRGDDRNRGVRRVSDVRRTRRRTRNSISRSNRCSSSGSRDCSTDWRSRPTGSSRAARSEAAVSSGETGFRLVGCPFRSVGIPPAALGRRAIDGRPVPGRRRPCSQRLPRGRRSRRSTERSSVGAGPPTPRW